ncbi:multidrug effflux MFS transporter [Pseudomonas fluorescens]|uniref:MFS transporter n=1 Tax=Pseudomonas fluorescens TaxID=294 RepID=UPI001130C483|nr:MFS transporter [Pseudomonas fluorescens]TMU81544.1 multidrug effflux MFS transporter [Pseudomonas fluorescens]
MNNRHFLWLAIALLMFAQIAQTLYSPALGDIGRVFNVDPQAATQTLSVYFLAFAVGVVVWGRLCDRIGRRPAMLAGLAIYAIATLLGLRVSSFNGLLLAQMLAAFGAAVGSVVTQTVLRDRFKGAELAQVFSLVGIALAASPAIGLFSGASLVQAFGYRGVLGALLLLAALLWLWSWYTLAETRPQPTRHVGLLETLGRMLRDPGIWRSALWIASFNVALFSYYSLAPFMFQRLGVSASVFGYSGVILALGSGFGAWLNRRLLAAGFKALQLIRLAGGIALLGGAGVWSLQGSVAFVLPMLLVVLAFGLAIPNVLGSALVDYADRLGTAGALLGLMYYLLIGAALILAGWFQALGETLIACSTVALLLTIKPGKAIV